MIQEEGAIPEDGRREGNAHMLRQDVDLGIMPIGGRSRSRPQFAVELRPDDGLAVDLLTEALGGDIPGDSLTETVCDFVRDVASSLVWEGRTLYEVVWGPPHAKDGTRRRFFLAHFPIWGVVRKQGSYIQGGSVLSMKTGQTEVRTASIPERDVLNIALPSFLGSAPVQPRFLSLLGRMYPYPPDWVLREWSGEVANSGYAFEKHRRETEILVANVTKPWGWDGRWAWRDHSLEYFQVFRALIFRRSLARLREHIIGQVNQVLRRLDFRTGIELVGLPSSAEVEDVIAELHAGRIDFKTALDRSSFS